MEEFLSIVARKRGLQDAGEMVSGVKCCQVELKDVKKADCMYGGSKKLQLEYIPSV
jgi:hypothetical protein